MVIAFLSITAGLVFLSGGVGAIVFREEVPLPVAIFLGGFALSAILAAAVSALEYLEAIALYSKNTNELLRYQMQMNQQSNAANQQPSAGFEFPDQP